MRLLVVRINLEFLQIDHVIRDTKRGWNGKKRLVGYGKKLNQITVAVGRWRWAGWLPRGRGQSRWEAGPTCSGQVRPVVGPFPPRAHLQPTVSLPRFLGAGAARARFFYSFFTPQRWLLLPLSHCRSAAPACATARGPAPRWTHLSSCRSLSRTSRFVVGFAVNFFFWGGFDFISFSSVVLIARSTVELL